MARIQLRNAAEPPATPFERGYNIILDDYPGDPVPIFPDGFTLYSEDSAGDGTASPYILCEDGTVIDLAALAGGGGGGTVTSVSGTSNRITSTGGATPVIDIAATYVGQSSITTLGTIITGVWNGSVIGAAYLDLSGKQPLDSDLTSIAALTTDSFGRDLLTKTSAANVRTYIGAGTGSGDALTTNPLSQFAATTSLQLKGVISDETGSGALVFADTPTLIAPLLGTPTSGNLANCTFPTLNQSTTGSAATLTTPRNINGVAFDGSANITVTAAAGTLTGTTLNATVVTSSLTTVGTIGTGVWQGTLIDSTYGGTGINNAGRTLTVNTNSGTIAFSVVGTTLTVAANASVSGTNTGDQTSVSGNAGTATALATGRTIGMTGDVTWTSPSFNGTGNVTAAGTIANNAVTYAKIQQGSARTMLANNTAGAANFAEQSFYDIPLATYGGTITWTGTAPTTIVSQQYAWSRIGNTVTLFLDIVYTNAGVTNTAVQFTLPSDCPTPVTIGGLGGNANEVMYSGVARVEASVTATPGAVRCYLQKNSANNGYIVGLVFGSVSAKVASFTIQYRVS